MPSSKTNEQWLALIRKHVDDAPFNVNDFDLDEYTWWKRLVEITGAIPVAELTK